MRLRHMRYNGKKAAACLAAVLLTGMLAILPAAGAFASDADAPAEMGTEEELISRSEYVTDLLVGLAPEEIEQYKDSTDDVTASLAEAWASSYEEAGSVLPDEQGETTVEQKSGKYTVTVPRKFEKASVKFIYIYDKRLNPEAGSIDLKLPMGTTLIRAIANTIMGILIVFGMLAFLSFVISRLQYVPGLVDKLLKKETPKPAAKAAPAAAAAAPAAVAAAAPVMAQEEDSQELIAVITAAIAAYESQKAGAGTDAYSAPGSIDGFVVRSIRKARRKQVY